MDIGFAVDALKKNSRVAREGWNGKNTYIFLVPGSQFAVNRPPLLGIFPEGVTINYQSHIDVCNEDGTIATWSPSNSDTLAEDWYIVD